ncbi:ferredoxin [Streptomyces hyaluromycini]|uniref:Ferredoxin n=1 Tax=Streptomyces hyaluromycini TaxID=1377993 RepID=A0ABV1XFQ5_9ACTN
MINIDRDLCIGSGQCALTAPTVFTQDDDGFAEVLSGQEREAARAAEAARACPVQAIDVAR